MKKRHLVLVPLAPARSRGFTLFELMLALAIAGILFGIGIPNFQGFVRSSRITSNTNDFIAAVYAARGEAVKRRAATVVCFSTNPTDPAADCAGNGTQGWIVFVDDADPNVPSANDRNVRLDAGEPVLQRHGAFPGTLRLRTLPAGNAGYISFSPSGQARAVAAVGQPLSAVTVCDDRGNTAAGGPGESAARLIEISPQGRPRVSRIQAEIALFGGCP